MCKAGNYKSTAHVRDKDCTNTNILLYVVKYKHSNVIISRYIQYITSIRTCGVQYIHYSEESKMKTIYVRALRYFQNSYLVFLRVDNSVLLNIDIFTEYRIHGLFGGDFNLAVWQITSESPNLSQVILKAIFKIKPLNTYMHAIPYQRLTTYVAISTLRILSL